MPEVLLASVLLLATRAPGQEPAPAVEPAPALPGDPAALMLLAVKSNGLTGEGIKPWHLKATFQLMDGAGKTTDQGTLEEFWAAPQKWKRVYTSAGFTQTAYGTDHGDFQLGASGSPPGLMSQIAESWLKPMPDEKLIDSFNFSVKPNVIAGLTLSCVTAISKQPQPYSTTHLYCFDATRPTLRISFGSSAIGGSGQGTLQITFNKSILFQGKFVASSLNVKSSAGDAVAAHIESLNILPSIDEADFLPPPDAKPAPKIVAIASAVAQGYLLHQEPPEYPSAAKDARMSGTVVIEAIITKDGRIRDARAVSGAKVFQGAALEAVRHWRYRPYLLNGQPVEVLTTINIVFNLWPER